MTRYTLYVLVILVLCSRAHAQDDGVDRAPDGLKKAFAPPSGFASDFGAYRSPLRFNDGAVVHTAADWQQRRTEIREEWFSIIGRWPAPIEQPKVELVAREQIGSIEQRRLKLGLSPKRTFDGYLLVPDGRGRRPAVLVVFYEPETAIGRGKPMLDFASQLSSRGFVTLSIGVDPRDVIQGSADVGLQPLSYLAYVASNAYNAMAAMPEVDPQRIGVLGHSYGGKWAMFASCLDDRFACGVWSDPGIVFDEKRGNVNYWEPWYLGYEKGTTRRPGLVAADNPRTGAYKQLVAAGHDLHELHALMAPRPFLVSGGSEDPPERWKALNHTRAVNALLGASNRVAMTNRPDHTPTAESNEQILAFFEYVLMSPPSR